MADSNAMRRQTVRPVTTAEIQAIRNIAAEPGQPYAVFLRLCDEVERLRGIERMVDSILAAESEDEELLAVLRLVLSARVHSARAA